MEQCLELIDKLYSNANLTREEIIFLIKNIDASSRDRLFFLARKRAREAYGNEIYIRGLIEISNICKNDCFYCGIRRSNKNAIRYRLTLEEIFSCCQKGFELGFRTFVLQGGEDDYFSDLALCKLIDRIKSSFPSCAVTLSLGEKTRESYEMLFNAGADRYLLRHESITKAHYEMLHPKNMSLQNRIRCLYDLKEIGFQVGCGFMVGAPFQSIEDIARDLEFIKDFSPEMVGIGPFISHKSTPFSKWSNGSVELTILLLGIIRLLLPNVLLPATTALSTLDKNGQRDGFLAGANVVMPNLSPMNERKKYNLYDGKAFLGLEAGENLDKLKALAREMGLEIAISKGDFRKQKLN